MDTKKLIDLAKSGDKEAFGALYSEFYVPVFRYIYLRVNNREEVEDLTQTVFLKVYQSIGNYQSTDADPLAYFFTVSRNTVIDFYRRKKSVSLEGNEQALEIPDLRNDPEEDFAKKESHNMIMSALTALPEDQQEVIILKFIEELSNSEIAKILNKNEPAIRQIQHRALKSLRLILNKDKKYE